MKLLQLSVIAILISLATAAPVSESSEIGEGNSEEQILLTSTSSSLLEITSSSTQTKSDMSLDLENIHLSKKLNSLYQRLAGLDPETLRTGVIKFRLLLIGSKSRDEFLTKLWQDKSERNDADGNGNPKAEDSEELVRFKSDLNELATFIAEKHPKVLSWFLSAVGGGRPETTTEKLSFLEKFSEIDEEMSTYPVWNRYWTYWFQSAGDYIAKHG